MRVGFIFVQNMPHVPSVEWKYQCMLSVAAAAQPTAVISSMNVPGASFREAPPASRPGLSARAACQYAG